MVRKSSSSRPRRRSAFTLVELLVVIAIIGVLVALLLPAIQAAREAARRSQCLVNMKNLSLGLLNYHDSRNHFPATISLLPRGDTQGSPARDAAQYLNWAIEALPYIEQQALFRSFTINDTTRLYDEVNRKARSTELPLMLCPSDGGLGQRFAGTGGDWARGNYGYNAFQWYPNAFLWRDIQSSPDFDYNIGMGGFSNGAIDQSQRLAQISDGSSNTIMLGEMRVGLSAGDRRGVWAMGMCGSNYHCRHAGFPGQGPNSCGGGDDDTMGVKDIELEVGESTLLAECMRPDPSVMDSGQSVVRSRHPGGVHVAMADGSARLISDFIQSGPNKVQSKFTTADGTTAENVFLAWQRLNVSRDGYSGGQAE